jgi:predicted enzyme related to lactoylglutathione lyase
MLSSASVVGFIPTTDFRKAKEFYSGKLGLSFVSEDDFALVLESGGTTIRVAKVNDFRAFGFTILGWRVERYPWMTQDDLGIWTAPGGTLVAWFKDPDGNVLSLSSR